jgi:two-component system response regulator MprA
MRLLVIEDDADLRRLLTRGLGEAGFEVQVAADGESALLAAERDGIGLIVLDIGLPDSDGRDLCQALRSRGISTPVLFLTARDSAPDRVSGFGAGGDDYLTKPFEFAELVARLNALARRAGSASGVSAGDLRLDPVRHGVAVEDRFMALTPTEFRLLGVLIARRDETIPRRDLVHAAWPPGAIVRDNTLEVYVARLRKKLTELDSAREILTAHGVGYRLR